MGLDSTQIIVDLERYFDIEISDQEAQQVKTVDELHTLVWSKVKHNSSAQCLFQVIFFKVRKAIRKNNNEQLIDPHTKVKDIINKEALADFEQQLFNELGLIIPLIKTRGLFKHSDQLFYNETVHKLCDKIVSLNSSLVREKPVAKTTVQSMVNIVLEDISGIKRTNIQPDHRIVKDLGVD